MILSNMLWLPKHELEYINMLKAQLTVKPKYDKENIRTFIETEDYFGIPRNFNIPPKSALDQRICPKKQHIEFTGKLRPVQQTMIDDWKKLYEAGIDDWVIKGDTGIGKTVIMLKIACELGVPFLVVVPLERLMTQWIDQIKKFTNIKEVGIIRQDQCEYKGIASVGMVHSLCKDKYPDEMKNHFGLVIYDELQGYASEHFSKTVSMFPAKHRCGASATLERQNGTQDVYFFHLGRKIISTEEKTQPKPIIYQFKYTESSGKLPHWIDIYDRIKTRAFLLSKIANNENRNHAIAEFASTLIGKKIQTLVIGDRISQLEEIQKILIKKGHNDTGLYIGRTPDKEKKRIEKEASCILATKKMLEVGIDIDTLRGVIFATPQSNVTQVVGRARRINLTMPDPIVIDIVDIQHKDAIRWYESRKKWYKQEGFSIKTITG